jgi:hypothetical protein
MKMTSQEGQDVKSEASHQIHDLSPVCAHTVITIHLKQGSSSSEPTTGRVNATFVWGVTENKRIERVKGSSI